VTLAAAALAGCGGGASPSRSSGPRLHVAIVVPDAVLRRIGEPCAGGDPFLYVHQSAPYRVENAQGRTVARGTLPAGRAIRILNQPQLKVPRQPTMCKVSIRVGVAPRQGYRLVLAQGGPQPLKVHGGSATVVLQ
jgi:hypothetical protein